MIKWIYRGTARPPIFEKKFSYMTKYIWELEDWPNFYWDASQIIAPLADARFKQGIFLGKMASLNFDIKLNQQLDAMTMEAIETSAIEGEFLHPESVKSSVARRLGLSEYGSRPTESRIEGLLDILFDATHNYKTDLTSERIFAWHAALFPTGYSGSQKIEVGKWRSDEYGRMEVISGAYGKIKVHYVAPSADRVPMEMDRFLAWFNDRTIEIDGLIRAFMAHFWFISIHGMADGNGRIARAITDLAMSQAESVGQSFYSISTQIEKNKEEYYNILEITQRGSLDITEYLKWFVRCYTHTIDHAETLIGKSVTRANFWDKHAAIIKNLSSDQKKILNLLLEDFKGFISINKWTKLCKCSKDQAKTQIDDLVDKHMLTQNHGKKPTYHLNV